MMIASRQVSRPNAVGTPSFRASVAWHRVLLVLTFLVITSTAAAAQVVSAPRLRTAVPPVTTPEAFGGGEVVLELIVDASGVVTRVNPVRVTPPFTDAMVSAVGSWRFEPAVALIKKRETPAPGRVLVIGVFRAPTLYAGPAPGAVPETRGEASPEVPRPVTLVPAAYPPNVLGDRVVLVEIELTARAEPREYRLVGAGAGFESAALDAVKAWRFSPPPAADAPERLFVYAVLGFRAPVVGPEAKQH